MNQNLSKALTSQLPDRMSAARYRAMLQSGALVGNSSSRTTTQRNTPEDDLHMACFEWVELSTPRYKILRWLFHTPNGGKRGPGVAGKLKAMGVRKGVPDFLCTRPNKGWSGLAIELKSDTGALSTDQKEWLGAHREDGYYCAVCRTLDQFIAAVMVYLNGKDDN